jgi:preprotein translocase subunit SecE
MSTEVRSSQARKPAKAGGPGRQERTTPTVFLREVRAELRKVVWPTRTELVTYTWVALIFILIMVALVSGVDYGLTRLVFRVFG